MDIDVVSQIILGSLYIAMIVFFVKYCFGKGDDNEGS